MRDPVKRSQRTWGSSVDTDKGDQAVAGRAYSRRVCNDTQYPHNGPQTQEGRTRPACVRAVAWAKAHCCRRRQHQPPPIDAEASGFRAAGAGGQGAQCVRACVRAGVGVQWHGGGGAERRPAHSGTDVGICVATRPPSESRVEASLRHAHVHVHVCACGRACERARAAAMEVESRHV